VQRFFTGVIESVIFILTKSQLALMILLNLKIVAFDEGVAQLRRFGRSIGKN
jgi:hypothetical protein